MAGTAVLRRLTWQVGTVVELVEETARTRSIVLDLPEWPGHRAGQHVDVRLTAEDGYQAQRSYSIASAPEDGQLVLTVERLDDGEVSRVPHRRAPLGRRARAARADRWVLRLGGVARRSASSRRRWLGRRPAPRDAEAPPGGRERRARAASLLGQDDRRRDLPRRACIGGLSRRDRHPLRAHPSLARGLAGLSPPHRPRRCSRRSPGRPPSARSSSSVARPRSSRRRPRPSSGSATAPTESRPSASARRGRDEHGARRQRDRRAPAGGLRPRDDHRGMRVRLLWDARRSGRLRGLPHRSRHRRPVSGLPGGSDGVRRGSRSDLRRLHGTARPGRWLASNARASLTIGIGSRRGGRTNDRAADPRRGGRRRAVARDRSRHGAAARACDAERRARRQARRARRGIAAGARGHVLRRAPPRLGLHVERARSGAAVRRRHRAPGGVLPGRHDQPGGGARVLQGLCRDRSEPGCACSDARGRDRERRREGVRRSR